MLNNFYAIAPGPGMLFSCTPKSQILVMLWQKMRFPTRLWQSEIPKILWDPFGGPAPQVMDSGTKSRAREQVRNEFWDENVIPLLDTRWMGLRTSAWRCGQTERLKKSQVGFLKSQHCSKTLEAQFLFISIFCTAFSFSLHTAVWDLLITIGCSICISALFFAAEMLLHLHFWHPMYSNVVLVCVKYSLLCWNIIINELCVAAPLDMC